MDLFRSEPVAQPLAARLRPSNLDEYVGQEHLLARGKPLREALEQGALHSMIFWGRLGGQDHPGAAAGAVLRCALRNRVCGAGRSQRDSPGSGSG